MEEHSSERFSVIADTLIEISERLDELRPDARIFALRVRAAGIRARLKDWLRGPFSEAERRKLMDDLLELTMATLDARDAQRPGGRW